MRSSRKQMMPRWRQAALLCSGGCLILLWMGCGTHRDAVHAPWSPAGERGAAAGGACVHDEDCRSSFCDRGVCMVIGETGNHGRECTVLVLSADPPLREGFVSERTADGLLSIPGPKAKWGPEDTCGGYLCLGERCRSCQSDSECQGWTGGPTCVSVAGVPGKRCGGSGGTMSTTPEVQPVPPS